MISVGELKNISNPNIIDIRNPMNYNNNHINGAINIPYTELIGNARKYLDRSKRYFIYCQKGITSKKVCQILNSLGYKTTNIIGGYEAWVLEN